MKEFCLSAPNAWATLAVAQLDGGDAHSARLSAERSIELLGANPFALSVKARAAEEALIGKQIHERIEVIQLEVTPRFDKKDKLAVAVELTDFRQRHHDPHLHFYRRTGIRDSANNVSPIMGMRLNRRDWRRRP